MKRTCWPPMFSPKARPSLPTGLRERSSRRFRMPPWNSWQTGWCEKNIEEAQAFVSDRALECVRNNASLDGKTLSIAEARRELHSILKNAAERLGAHQTLSPFIQAVAPWRKGFQIINHPYSSDFTLLGVPDAFADAFLCESVSREAGIQALEDPNAQYGRYFGILFKVRTTNNQGAVLGVLWAKESGAWRIIAYQTIRP